jgi:hypothetical protein
MCCLGRCVISLLEGQNLKVEYRYGGGEALDALAAELAKRQAGHHHHRSDATGPFREAGPQRSPS